MFATINVQQKNKDSVIKKTCKILAAGGIVVFPSDTVYGLLVDATNEQAVKKLIEFKNRPIGKAISIFVSDFTMLNTVVQLPSQKLGLVHHLLPGPFTIILKSKKNTSKLLESEKSTLGVRIPQYQLVQDLVRAYGKPVTATSANLGGKSPHYSINSLLNQLPDAKKQLIDLIVDAGNLPRNKPSTVVDLTTPTLKIVRRGDITFSKSDEYISSSPSQTKKIGSYIANKISKEKNKKPVIIVLQGDLGSGKTVLTKGIASHFGIHTIISPTFVVYYEYDIQESIFNKFIHADLYNIEESEEFKHLRLEKYLRKGVIMCIEWGEKLGDVYKVFKNKGSIIHLKIEYTGKNERKIIISRD